MYMQFLNKDQFLATCSGRQESQVIVYNIQDSSSVLSIKTNDFAVDLITISHYTAHPKVSFSYEIIQCLGGQYQGCEAFESAQ